MVSLPDKYSRFKAIFLIKALAKEVAPSSPISLASKSYGWQVREGLLAFLDGPGGGGGSESDGRR